MSNPTREVAVGRLMWTLTPRQMAESLLDVGVVLAAVPDEERYAYPAAETSVVVAKALEAAELPSPLDGEVESDFWTEVADHE